MKIGIACDHAGYDLKLAIIKDLKDKGYQLSDHGCDNGFDSVDYPDIATNLSKKYIAGEFDFGILICGSGIGISIAANRFKEVRAALCHDENTATLSRQHNDANIICLGARIVDEEAALKSINAFLNTKFSGARHQNRVNKLSS
jgi:ribose 5-phosphate isomerase B